MKNTDLVKTTTNTYPKKYALYFYSAMFLASAALGAAMVKYGRKSGTVLGDKVSMKKKTPVIRPVKPLILTSDHNDKIDSIRKRMLNAETAHTRRKLINEFYDVILTEPDPDNANNKRNIDVYVYNASIKANIYVTDDSRVETRFQAARNKQSALAVLKLKEILQNAIKLTEKVELLKIKGDTKAQQKFTDVVLLYYEISGLGIFQLTLGVKKAGKLANQHIQYCVADVVEVEIKEAYKNKKRTYQ